MARRQWTSVSSMIKASALYWYAVITRRSGWWTNKRLTSWTLKVMIQYIQDRITWKSVCPHRCPTLGSHILPALSLSVVYTLCPKVNPPPPNPSTKTACPISLYLAIVKKAVEHICIRPTDLLVLSLYCYSHMISVGFLH
ncbi:uncharacterized protein LOC113858855 [Abrus precatorius]|uniref:Uncharacterized protein LOC113858855 n=1 Tax=Abrus precatorius TaxID=3816 RepID=A0A8B8KU38_ABRPR|nr:uncharacterized protein LOC113858855 [Abrus precatorius]